MEWQPVRLPSKLPLGPSTPASGKGALCLDARYRFWRFAIQRLCEEEELLAIAVRTRRCLGDLARNRRKANSKKRTGRGTGTSPGEKRSAAKAKPSSARRGCRTNGTSLTPSMVTRARWAAAYLLQLDTFGVKLVPFVGVTDARNA
jgi:hypothetical protein